jgi:hypothetical protein
MQIHIQMPFKLLHKEFETCEYIGLFEPMLALPENGCCIKEHLNE